MPTVTFTTGGALKKSALRQANERVILNAIRLNPAISRADLARLTGLSVSSISFIMNRLTRAGIVIETPVQNHSQVGRRPTELRLASDARLAVAVELAPTGCRVALVNVEGAVIRRKPVAWHPNHDVIGRRIQSAIRSLIQERETAEVLGVGVAVPGTVDRVHGRVVAAENLGWFNTELGASFRGDLELPIYFENNARASALAIRWFTSPASRLPSDFIFVTPAGGVGAGIVANGRLLLGGCGMAGEIGHMVIRPGGISCVCGNRGCLEQYASDRALVRQYKENSGCDAIEAAAIVASARSGEASATEAVHSALAHLGEGLANLVWIFNPEAMILGGYVAEAWDLAEEALWGALRSRLPRYALDGLHLTPSEASADTALLGAASLVFAHYFTTFEHTEDSNGRQVVMTAGR